MAEFSATGAVGVVLMVAGSDAQMTGTCFGFRHDEIALTAAHCVPADPDVPLYVVGAGGSATRVVHVERHPDADIAALLTADPGSLRGMAGTAQHAFWDGVSNWSIGEEFLAYGYPTEGPNPASLRSAAAPNHDTPVPRLFVGHFQRFFFYESPSGFKYEAGEMSIPAPGGLSGGPLFRRGAPPMVTGLVTANHDSYAITDSVEDVEDEGRTFRLESRRVISYGVALMLSGVAEWLNDLTPLRGSTGWVLTQT
jgi:hypothetical protein